VTSAPLLVRYHRPPRALQLRKFFLSVFDAGAAGPRIER
jgi:hypothetical protein